MKQHKGFTLIEVMIVVAILGILAGIAYPSYMESVRKSNRADAKASLNDTAQRLQRCFTAYSVYNHDDCTVAASITDGSELISPEEFYAITAEVNANNYELTATPRGAQANDAKCTTFTLDSAGVRGATGSDAANCW